MISIIIPTLNEARNLSRILPELALAKSRYEIIIVDGGSVDHTLEIAVQHGAQTVQSPPGRGMQLRKGAEIASGDILWFLHADSQVAPEALDVMERELALNPHSPGGNFRLLFDGDDAFSNWLNAFYSRIRAKGIYYGDSGVYVRRQIYETLGGFRSLALMEDYDFNRRLERLGPTLLIKNPPLVTSSRRFAGRGKWAIISGWMIIHILFHLRLPSSWLAYMYDSARRQQN